MEKVWLMKSIIFSRERGIERERKKKHDIDFKVHGYETFYVCYLQMPQIS
jgi:hypothetical protein